MSAANGKTLPAPAPETATQETSTTAVLVVDPTERPAKRSGRVPGSGRKKGTPNFDRAATTERIMKKADPLNFLCKIVKGDRFSAGVEADGRKKEHWVVPTLDQRITAAQILARKVLPDMKAIEATGSQGEPFVFQFISGGGSD